MKQEKSKSYSFFYRNSLTIVFLGLFVISMALQFYTGLKEYNSMLKEEHATPVRSYEYLKSGHFIQATFENWESEFFQMALFVILTVSLRQKGSSESNPMEDSPDKRKAIKPSADAPWPVKRGGIVLKLYEHSLSIALTILFLISFGMHWYGSLKDYNIMQTLAGEEPSSAIAFLGKSKLWFETFQNWQSEFLSIVAIVYLSVFLREKGSAQSKAVDSPHTANE